MSSPTGVPLTTAQRGVWSMDQGRGRAFVMEVRAHLRGPLDRPALSAAWDDVVRKHPVLRSRVQVQDDGTPRLVAADGPTSLEFRSTAAGHDLEPGFDLRSGPLARGRVTPSANGGHDLAVCVHHLVFDGHSKDVLMHDLVAAYNRRVGAAAGPTASPSTPPPLDLPVPPPVAPDASARAAAFWQARPLPEDQVRLPGLVHSATAPAQAPADAPAQVPGPWHERPAPGAEVRQVLPGHLLEALDVRARDLGSSRFEILLSAWLLLLHRYGNPLVTVGLDLSSRTPAQVDRIGLFVNQVPLTSRHAPEDAWADGLSRLRQDLREIYRHRHVPYPEAVPGLRPRTTLAPVTISYRRRRPDPVMTGVRSSYDWSAFSGHALNLLHLHVVDAGEAVEIAFRFSPDRLHPDGAATVADGYVALLEGVLHAPDARLSRVDVTGPRARRMVVETFNETGRTLPLGVTTILDLIAGQVTAAPDAVAAVCGADQLSYRQLWGRAAAVARSLRRRGVGPGVPVGLCAQRSPDLIVAVLGILRSGAAYLPLDPEYPATRLSHILTDSAAPVVVGQPDLLAGLPHHPGTTHVALSALTDAVEDETEPLPMPAGDDTAYVIYTSGSTGHPKGVPNLHRGLLNRLVWMQRAYDLTPHDAVLQKTSTSFDVSVWELLWPLTAGARLVLAAPQAHRDPTALAATIQEHGVTVTHFVPSALAAFLDLLAQEPGNPPHIGAGACSGLRLVICSGEELGVPVARSALQAFPEAQLHNLYGPTEAAIDVTSYPVTSSGLAGASTVPIGAPIDNTQVYVLDERLQPLGVGVPGELYLAGEGLALGYLNQPALTADRFLPNPYGPPGTRLYRTGDRARWRPDATLDFLGRTDHQIKLRGHRIEPAEIETALTTHPHIRHAIVTPTPGNPTTLTAYLLTTPDTPTPTPTTLRTHLRTHLPEHHIPTHYLTLTTLPLTPNGKLDRTALPTPDPTDPAETADGPDGGQAPRASRGRQADESSDVVLAAVVSIVAEVLKADDVGPDDDFFDLGAHSLSITAILGRLRRRLDAKVTLGDLYDHPTAREVSDLIRGSQSLP